MRVAVTRRPGRLLSASLRLLVPALLAGSGGAWAGTILVEAEAFAEHGGWVVDPQFTEVMGSPYLLAHGLGRPVANARTTVRVSERGRYHVWARTRDWVPSHHPGRFEVVVNGKALPRVLGAWGTGWGWERGGAVTLGAGRVRLELRDLTGFEARCDALLLTTEQRLNLPRKPGGAMMRWRRRLLGLPAAPPSTGSFEVVVVGGGVAGCSAALTAGGLGLKVALVQDRPVLGGNASTEIGIHPQGLGGPIVDEVVTAPERRRAIEAEQGLSLFLGWGATGVRMDGDRIRSVEARHIERGEEIALEAPLFVDCTGDGWVGYWAGAEFRMGRECRAEFGESLAPEQADGMTHGSTLFFETRHAPQPVPFPPVPWATEVSGDHVDLHSDHTWEYGHFRDMIGEAEEIRDHLLRAIYGTFATAKQQDPEQGPNLELVRVDYIAARGESRRLLGDHLLTQNDLQSGELMPDTVALGSLVFCLHSPSPEYDFRNRIQLVPVDPYPIPFRCLYSRNVANLMMAGRDISATHVAFCSTKLMKTGGQMGRATGAAAFLCRQHGTTPRGVGERHIVELQDILLGRGVYAGALDP